MSSYAQRSDAWRCDACGVEMAFSLFCQGCGADYAERRGMSPFGILGLEQSFELSEEVLDHCELALAQEIHPDRWASRGERLQRKAVIAQSAINEALAALRDPFARGETLMGLQPEVQAGALEDRPQLPTTFLVEQLEWQEEIEDGVDRTRKRELASQARTSLALLRDSLSEHFAYLSSHPKGDERLDRLLKVRDSLDRSRYWKNIQRALRGQAPS